MGKALVSQLRNSNYSFDLWNRKEDGSILDSTARRKKLDSQEFYAVIHLAWNSISDKNYDRDELNTKFETETIKFRREIIDRDIKFITLGTVFEGLPIENGNLYQKSKLEIAKEFAEDSFTKTVWISPTYIFSFSLLRPRVINALSNDPFIKIRNPDLLCDWIEVRDVASALKNSLQFNEYGQINLSSDIILGVGDFANRFRIMSDAHENLENLDGQLEENYKVVVHQSGDKPRMSSSVITRQYLSNI